MGSYKSHQSVQPIRTWSQTDRQISAQCRQMARDKPCTFQACQTWQRQGQMDTKQCNHTTFNERCSRHLVLYHTWKKSENVVFFVLRVVSRQCILPKGKIVIIQLELRLIWTTLGQYDNPPLSLASRNSSLERTTLNFTSWPGGFVAAAVHSCVLIHWK